MPQETLPGKANLPPGVTNGMIDGTEYEPRPPKLMSPEFWARIDAIIDTAWEKAKAQAKAKNELATKGAK